MCFAGSYVKSFHHLLPSDITIIRNTGHPELFDIIRFLSSDHQANGTAGATRTLRPPRSQCVVSPLYY